MRIEVKVPQLPESVAEATLVNWHKKAGEAVARDENLVDIETDKVVLELPAPQARRAGRDRQGGRRDGRRPAKSSRSSTPRRAPPRARQPPATLTRGRTGRSLRAGSAAAPHRRRLHRPRCPRRAR